jgi:hypothetical protein
MPNAPGRPNGEVRVPRWWEKPADIRTGLLPLRRRLSYSLRLLLSLLPLRNPPRSIPLVSSTSPVHNQRRQSRGKRNNSQRLEDAVIAEVIVQVIYTWYPSVSRHFVAAGQASSIPFVGFVLFVQHCYVRFDESVEPFAEGERAALFCRGKWC